MFQKCIIYVITYTDSPKWIKDKETTENPRNSNDNNCFQYAKIAANKDLSLHKPVSAERYVFSFPKETNPNQCWQML